MSKTNAVINGKTYYGVANMLEAIQLYKDVDSLSNPSDESKLVTCAWVNNPNSLLQIKQNSAIQYLPEQLVAYNDLEVKDLSGPIDFEDAIIEIDGVDVRNSDGKYTNVKLSVAESENTDIIVNDGEDVGDINRTITSPLQNSITRSFTFTNFKKGHVLRVQQNSAIHVPGNVNTNLSGNLPSITVKITWSNAVTSEVINTSSSSASYTNSTTSSSGTCRITINSLPDKQVNLTLGTDTTNAEWEYDLTVTMEETVPTAEKKVQMCPWENSEAKNKHLDFDDGTAASPKFSVFPAVSKATTVNKGEIDLHLVQSTGVTGCDAGSRQVAAPFPTSLQFWRIGLSHCIERVSNYKSTFAMNLKKIELFNYLTNSSSSTVTSESISSSNAVKETFQIPGNSSYSCITADCSEISACVTNGYAAKYSMPDPEREDSFGIYLKLNLDNNILPDSFSVPICSIVVTVQYSFTDLSISDEWIGQFKINLWYDPSGTVPLSESVCTYTTTDDVKLSLPTSMPFNVTQSAHNYDASTKTGQLIQASSPTQVAQRAFANLTTLKTIKLPSKIKTFNNSIFEGCTNLTSVSLPDSLNTVGVGCFKGCSQYKRFELTQSHTSDITCRSNIFENSGISQIIIDKTSGNLILDQQSFASCPNLTTLSINQHTKLSSIPKKLCYNTPSLAAFQVPYAVVSIGESAFENSGLSLCSLLTGSQIQSIDSKAFYKSNLAAMMFGNATNLKTLGASAFESSQLQQIWDIPSSITTIGNRCFAGTYISEITIPQKVVTLGGSGNNSPFIGCTRLTTIKWNAENFDKNTAPFANVCSQISSLTFGSSVKIIADSLFSKCNIPSLYLPSTLKTIRHAAFYSCSKIANDIIIPDSVTQIENSAFYASGMPRIVFSNNISELAAGVCFQCPNLKTAEFTNYNAICQTIGSQAFQNCTQLSIVKLPKTIHTIGPSAFENCSNFTFQTAAVDTTYASKYASSTNYIFDSVKIIKNKALHNTKWYKDHAATNGGWALMWVNKVFYRMTAKSVSSALNAVSVDLSQATCVTDDAFGYWDGTFGGGFGYVHGLTLPGNNCLYIGDGAFMGIEFVVGSGTYNPSSLQYLGGSAFEGTQFFSKFIAPVSLTYVGSNVFRNCKKRLTGLDFRNYKGETIPVGLCDGCSKLTIDSEFWPSTVKGIGDRAFQGIDVMYWNSLPTTIETIGNNAFHNISHSMGSLPSGWANNLTSVGNEAFRGVSLSIGNVVAPKLLSIGENAFRGSTITSFKPKRATGDERVYIGPHAFYNCDQLKTVWIPKNCYIGDQAFNSCGALSTVYFEGTQAEWNSLKNNTTGSNPLFKASIYYGQTW